MKRIKRKIPFIKWLFYSLSLGMLYSAFVLSFVWWHCYQSPLTGGKNGPLDAYRHTLASAVVAYTLSPKVVSVISHRMENKHIAAGLMDRHNNAIGAKIGVQATTFSSLPYLVSVQTKQGKVNTSDPNQTTWLPKSEWKESVLW